MYYTHLFSHTETLTRARNWLIQLGFRPEQIESHADGMPRLAVALDPERLAEVAMVINAIERSDPDGWPSFWESARHGHHHADRPAEEALPGPSRPSTAVIGWHPIDTVMEVTGVLR
jgi:hypothetical protein